MTVSSPAPAFGDDNLCSGFASEKSMVRFSSVATTTIYQITYLNPQMPRGWKCSNSIMSPLTLRELAVKVASIFMLVIPLRELNTHRLGCRFLVPDSRCDLSCPRIDHSLPTFPSAGTSAPVASNPALLLTRQQPAAWLQDFAWPSFARWSRPQTLSVAFFRYLLPALSLLSTSAQLGDHKI